MPAPIALFAFNRPDHLRRTFDALAANRLAEQSSLTIFCDGPRTAAEAEKTDAVRILAREEVRKSRFERVRVVERPQNMGCANAVIAGLTEMFSAHERLIVIEDDIITSQYTLAYLNEGLERYETYNSIWSISAWSPPKSLCPLPDSYPYDVYAIPRFNSPWGWASWKNRFQNVDWDVSDYSIFLKSPLLTKYFNAAGKDLSIMLAEQMTGKSDSWALRVEYTRFKRGCLCINPVKSYTTNIGMGSGTHTLEFTTKFDNDLKNAIFPNHSFRWITHIFVSKKICTAFCKGYSLPPLWKKIIKYTLKIVGLYNMLKLTYFYLKKKIQ